MSWTSRTAATCASGSGKSFWTHSVLTTFWTSSLWAAPSGISEQLYTAKLYLPRDSGLSKTLKRGAFFLMRRKKCAQKIYLFHFEARTLRFLCGCPFIHDAEKSMTPKSILYTIYRTLECYWKMTCLKFNISSCCNPKIFQLPPINQTL